MLRYKTKTRPGLVALYDTQPGNRAGLFLQPQSPHGALGSCSECRIAPNGRQSSHQATGLGCKSTCRLLSPTTTIAIYSILHLLCFCLLLSLTSIRLYWYHASVFIRLKQAVTAYNLEQHIVTAEEITVKRGAASEIELICTKTQMM